MSLYHDKTNKSTTRVMSVHQNPLTQAVELTYHKEHGVMMRNLVNAHCEEYLLSVTEKISIPPCWEQITFRKEGAENLHETMARVKILIEILVVCGFKEV